MVLTETDIANLALGLLGAQSLIAAGALRTEDSNNAATLRNNYDTLRRSELRRNVWRMSIRTVALRSIGDFSKFVTFATWLIGTTYAINDVVLASDGQVYSSLVAANIAFDPTTNPTKWTLFFGNTVAQEYVMTWNSGITYDIGNHTVGSDGSVYISIQDNNLNKNPISQPTWWTVASTLIPPDLTIADNQNYYAGEIVYVGRRVYISKQSSNDGDPGGVKWLLLTGTPTLSAPNFIYPIGSGPSGQTSTKNAYRLPNGYLRQAPKDPKQGSVSFLGGPSALPYDDWVIESNFITTRDSGVLLFRFAADISDPTQFDPMFVEGFAARLAADNCESLTQSNEKKDRAEKKYKEVMTEARIVNGIETGPTEAPEDEYIAVRI